MKVLIPTPLRSYTGARQVVARGGTLAEVLADLELCYPGIRFRMIDEQGCVRPHLRFFVNGQAVRDLAVALLDTDEVSIVQALSGG